MIHVWRTGIFEDPSLSISAKAVAYTLSMYYREGRDCFPSLPALAENCNCVVNTIRKAITELETMGYINKKMVRRKGLQSHLSTIYQFVLPQGQKKTVASNFDSANDSANDSAKNDSEYREYREDSEVVVAARAATTATKKKLYKFHLTDGTSDAECRLWLRNHWNDPADILIRWANADWTYDESQQDKHDLKMAMHVGHYIIRARKNGWKYEECV